MEYGEIEPDQIPPVVEDGFIEHDNATGRAFYVPDLIGVYKRTGKKYRGRFVLNPENGSAIEETARVEPTATIGAQAIIGAESYIGHDVSVGKLASIEDRVRVSMGAIICARGWVGRKTSLKQFARVGYRATVGSRCELGEGSIVPEGERVFSNTTLPADTVFGSTEK